MAELSGKMRALVERADGLTPFQRRVYLALIDVPAGVTITYGELGRRIGCRSAQAIGQALRRNPFAVGLEYGTSGPFTSEFCVPCHRVISSDGSLGGFSGHRSGPDVDRKRELLRSEGVEL